MYPLPGRDWRLCVGSENTAARNLTVGWRRLRRARLQREPSPPIFDDDYCFRIGSVARLREGRDLLLASTGVQTTRTLEADELLATRGVDASVLHCPTIKPIDEQALVEAALATGFVVTVEVQNVLGVLGGAVAEIPPTRHPYL